MCHLESRFLTLTYAKDPGTLDYQDFQLFLKRYRENLGPCRFFAIGEYGEENGRGHWHALIFGHGPEKVGLIDLPSWGHGGVSDGTVTPDSIGYCVGYIMKGEIDEALRPITRRSLRPGIGFDRIRSMARSIAKIHPPITAWPDSYRIGGTWYPLCDGGLACFKTEYLESGGAPPREASPLERAAKLRLAWLDWGTRNSEKDLAYNSWRREQDDQAAARSKSKA